MYKLTLIRFSMSDQGTQGILLINDNFFCHTLELPWNDNIRKYSCIPLGKYKIIRHKYHGYLKSYHLLNVPNRSSILIHSGNFAGDPREGYMTHVEGCILVGKYFGFLNGQQAILCSRPTLSKLIEITHWNADVIEIKDVNPSKYSLGDNK